jgi:hypothetical protein
MSFQPCQQQHAHRRTRVSTIHVSYFQLEAGGSGGVTSDLLSWRMFFRFIS